MVLIKVIVIKRSVEKLIFAAWSVALYLTIIIDFVQVMDHKTTDVRAETLIIF